MEYRESIEPTAKIVAGDRRLTMRLMGLWQGLRRASETCPVADDFVAAVPEDLWTDCCIIALSADGGWEMRSIGNTIGSRSGVVADRVPLSELPPHSLLAVSTRDMGAAISCGVPILDEGEVVDENGRRALFRSILLPLGDETGHVEQLVAGARCRVCLEDA